MRFAICDDDMLFISELKAVLQEFFAARKIKDYNITSYSNGQDLISSKEKPDLLFLDMEMPGMDGIETAISLKKSSPNLLIIVITGYECFLDDAMACNVFRYLSKPLDKNRLFRNLDAALIKLSENNNKLLITHSMGSDIVSLQEIVLVEYNAHTIIHTVRDKLSVSEPFETWRQKLSGIPCFYHSHRNYIVNFNYVQKFDHYQIFLNVNNQIITAALTKRKYSDFKHYFLRYKT